MIVTLEEAKNSLEELIARSERGEEITIVESGAKPIARLVHVETDTLAEDPQQGKRLGGWTFGLGKGTIWMADDFDETPEEFRDYM